MGLYIPQGAIQTFKRKNVSTSGVTITLNPSFADADSYNIQVRTENPSGAPEWFQIINKTGSSFLFKPDLAIDVVDIDVSPVSDVA